MTLLTLPHELVERILVLLDNESVQICRLANKELNDIIQSSTFLRHILACEAAGVIDNPRSSLSYAKRTGELKKREDAWRKLKPVFETTIKVHHQLYLGYGLAGGAYFVGNNNQKDLNYCHLPSCPQDNTQWIRVPGHGTGEGLPGIFITFATALHEHDLIINFISSDAGSQADVQLHSLDMILLKFSTGEYHPLARHPRIHVQRSSSARPWVIARISGNNLALVVHNQEGTLPDKLFIFDWKTSHKRLQHEEADNAFRSPVFISPEIVLVPNLILNHFEIWHLPSEFNKPPVQILSLQIPAISPDYYIFSFTCNGEPNPFLYSMPYMSPRPFFSSPEDSIVIANLCILSNSPFVSRRRSSYTLVMHRRALLDTIQKWTSSPLLRQQEDLPTWLTNEVTINQVADPDGGLVRLDTQSKLVSMSPRPKSFTRVGTFPTNIPTDCGSSSIPSELFTGSSTSRYNFLQVQWADWGPPISRWFQVNETQAQWIKSSTGQRYAFSNPDPHGRGNLMVSVADFNPYNVRRNMGMTGRHQENEGDDQKDEGENLETLNHGGAFSEEVHMGLKCVIYHAPDKYDFDAVLIDEERLLGLKLNRERRVESIKVLYFG